MRIDWYLCELFTCCSSQFFKCKFNKNRDFLIFWLILHLIYLEKIRWSFIYCTFKQRIVCYFFFFFFLQQLLKTDISVSSLNFSIRFFYRLSVLTIRISIIHIFWIIRDICILNYMSHFLSKKSYTFKCFK